MTTSVRCIHRGFKRILFAAVAVTGFAAGATEFGPNLIVNGGFDPEQTILPEGASYAFSNADGFSCEGWSAGLDVGGNPTTFVATKYENNGYGNVTEKPQSCVDYMAALRYDVYGVRLRQQIELSSGLYWFSVDYGRQENWSSSLEPCGTKVELVRLDAAGQPTDDIQRIAMFWWRAGDDRAMRNFFCLFEIAEQATYELRFRNIWVSDKNDPDSEVENPSAQTGATMCIDNVQVREIKSDDNLLFNGDFHSNLTSLPKNRTSASSDQSGCSCIGWSAGLDVKGDPASFVLSMYSGSGVSKKPETCTDNMVKLPYSTFGVLLRQNVDLWSGKHRLSLDWGRSESWTSSLEPCCTKVELVRLDADGQPTDDIQRIAVLWWRSGEDREMRHFTYDFEVAKRGTFELRFRNVWVPGKGDDDPEEIVDGKNGATMCIDNVCLTEVNPIPDGRLTVTRNLPDLPSMGVYPEYGEHDGYELGQTVVCSAVDSRMVLDGLTYVCTGWRLKGLRTGDLLADGKGTVCRFEFPDEPVNLEWQIDLQPTKTFKYLSVLTIAGYEKEDVLEGFPLLVRLSPERIAGFTYADAGSPDRLAFFDVDGTALSYEVDTWKPDGESLVWVKTKRIGPQLANKIVFCWGRSKPVANVPSDTWSEFASVWHFDEDGDDQLDSTTNGMTQTCTSGKSGPADGVVGKSAAHTANFFSVSDYMNVAGVAANCHSASFWYWFPSLKTSGKYLAVFKLGDWATGDAAKAHSWYVEYNEGSEQPQFLYCREGKRTTMTGFDASQGWAFVTVVCEGKKVRLYVNGELNATCDLAEDMKAGTYPCVICSCSNTLSYNDESRVRNAASSAGWVWADYHQVVNPDFVTATLAKKTASRGMMILFQ